MLIAAQIFAFLGLLVSIFGIVRRYQETKRRLLPVDRSPLKGSPTHGISYAFTTGMLPWAKESTRIHMIAYLRGIGFHIGIFTALAALLISPFWSLLPGILKALLAFVLMVGALLGASGGILRLVDHNLRGLSLPDDHFAVWLVTLFMTLAAFAVWNASLLIPFYVISAVTLLYVPFGKIRHCLYFFFSRYFFGKFFGRRAVLPHPEMIK